MNILRLKSFSMHYLAEDTETFQDASDASQKMHSKHTVLDNITCEVKEGDKIAILGNSGAGKTSLLYAVQHYLYQNESILYEGILDRPSTGVFSIKQNPKAALNPLRSVQGQFSVLHQSKDFPNMQKLSKAEILNYLKLVGFVETTERTEKGAEKRTRENPETLLKKRPYQLSGGMAQRVMVALLLAMKVKCLLADEVSASLDIKTESSIIEMLMQHVPTVLLVTHRLHLVKKYCNRVLFFHDGKIVFDGSAKDFMVCPHVAVKNYIDNILLSHKDIHGLRAENRAARDLSHSVIDAEEDV